MGTAVGREGRFRGREGYSRRRWMVWTRDGCVWRAGGGDARGGQPRRPRQIMTRRGETRRVEGRARGGMGKIRRARARRERTGRRGGWIRASDPRARVRGARRAPARWRRPSATSEDVSATRENAFGCGSKKRSARGRATRRACLVGTEREPGARRVVRLARVVARVREPRGEDASEAGRAAVLASASSELPRRRVTDSCPRDEKDLRPLLRRARGSAVSSTG